jgi:hypothetical protein
MAKSLIFPIPVAGTEYASQYLPQQGPPFLLRGFDKKQTPYLLGFVKQSAW